MESLITAWSNLTVSRKVIAVLAVVAVVASIWGLSRGATAPQTSLLYGGLEQRAAGEVVNALEQRGIAYEIRGDSIYVPSAMRDELRMSLAAEGLPANNNQGYELLDGLSGFGTTSQMFDAAYWRAKEGELARTIVASPHIRAARVHISAPTNRPFQREITTTAAVTVTTTGMPLTTSQANALRFLVASSVSGLQPADVAVIDSSGGLVGSADESAAEGAQALSDELRMRAERLLFARVGPGNAVIEVSVETLNESESIVERRIDPESRVAISTEVEERSSSAQDSGESSVTVASNLPTGDAGSDGSSSTSQDSETRSLTNYEVSETSREVRREPGTVRRMTVAVLVNDIATLDEAGNEVREPRGAEELATLSALVASAVGIDESRGDVITIQSLPFEPVSDLGTDAQPTEGAPLDMMTLIQLGVLALVALVLGLFVVRPILTARAPQAVPAIGNDDAPDDIFLPMNEMSSRQMLADAMSEFDDDGGGAQSYEEADPVTRLRRLIEERQDETIQILQNWIEEPDNKEQV